MKKLIALLAIITMLTGCSDSSASSSNSPSPSADSASTSGETTSSLSLDSETDMSASYDGVIEIREKMFVAQTNEIYLNYKDYLGGTFTYEGIYATSEWNANTYYYVIRYGPGCCNYDQEAGFEIQWDGEEPEENDWVKIVGVLDTYEEDGNEYLIMRLSSLEVMDTRGAEYVYQ